MVTRCLGERRHPRRGAKELRKDPLTFAKGFQGKKRGPVKSPKKEWAEGWEGVKRMPCHRNETFQEEKSQLCQMPQCSPRLVTCALELGDPVQILAPSLASYVNLSKAN